MINNKTVVLRIGLIVSFASIDYTLITDIAGGYIIEIIIAFLASKSFLAKGIGLVYAVIMVTWIFSFFWKDLKTEKTALSVSSIVMIAPLVLNLFFQIKAWNFELGFIIPVFIFCFFLVVVWRDLLKAI